MKERRREGKREKIERKKEGKGGKNGGIKEG